MTLLSAQPGIPACRADRLAASLDGRAGDFNGMSHSGTLLVLRNRGAACRIDALPQVRFKDAHGRVLPIERKAPIGMHPGPAMVPVILPKGGVASMPLRWVSGPVFDPGRCLRPTRLSVLIGKQELALPFKARLCGPAHAPATFDQPLLRLGLNTGL